MRLEGKIGIVTAAASGMGRAGALRFAREGAAVGVVDIDQAGRRRGGRRDHRGGRPSARHRRRSAAGRFRPRIVRHTANAFGGLDFVWNHVGHPGPGLDRGHRHGGFRDRHRPQSAHRAGDDRGGDPRDPRPRRRQPALHRLDLGHSGLGLQPGLLDGQVRRGRLCALARQAPGAGEDPRQRDLPRPDRHADAAGLRRPAGPAAHRRARTRRSWSVSAAARTRWAAPAGPRRSPTPRCS